MFDLIDGLPVHPLVVHAVVVLLPLACLGTIAIVVRPAWRQRYGVLVVACAAVACVLMPVATSSGEQLKHHVGDPGEHAHLGDQLIWFSLPMLVLVLVLVVLDVRHRRSVDTTAGASVVAGTSNAARVVAVLALVAAVAAAVQVYRVGESGARAAWGDQVQNTIPDRHH